MKKQLFVLMLVVVGGVVASCNQNNDQPSRQADEFGSFYPTQTEAEKEKQFQTQKRQPNMQQGAQTR